MKKNKEFKTWKVKNVDKNKEYKTILGHTDYDIPMFGYRSAFFIMTSILISVILVILICRFFNVDNRIYIVIFSSITCGFSFSFSQFFIETKRGFCKKFYILSIILSILSAFLMYIIIFGGI